MYRWSVRYEFAEWAIPAEMERLRPIFTDIERDSELRIYAKGSSRSFERRPQADDYIRFLKTQPKVERIELINTEGKGSRHRESWTRPQDLDEAGNGIVFASGLSRSNKDLADAIALGKAVGVSVHTALSERVRRMLVEHVSLGGKLFVDSGAFTSFTTGAAVDWDTVMGRYKELFYRVLPEGRHNFYLVAPDVVGDYAATAELHRQLYGKFQFIMEDGGNVIVPCHRGPSDTIDPGAIDTWWPRQEYPERFIIGIPFNKAAWSEDEVIAWMSRDWHADKRIHLLGGGPSKVRSLIERANAMGLRYAAITGDAFHGPARDRKFQESRTPFTPPKMKSLIGSEEEHMPESPVSVGSSPATALTGRIADADPALFRFRIFQADDMARAALHLGALLGWEPGLGKTMPAFAMPFLWRARLALIVVQADLHEQLITEGREKFGVNVRIIDSQETALRYMAEGILPYPGSRDSTPLPDGEMPDYFITAYNWLGYNGGDEWNPEEPTDAIRARRLGLARRVLKLAEDQHALMVTGRNYKPTNQQSPWEVLQIPEGSDLATIRKAFRTVARLYHPDLHPGDTKAKAMFQLANAAYERLTGKDLRNFDERLNDFSEEDPEFATLALSIKDLEAGIGKTENGIKCVFAPTLASIIHSTFDCVVCDEAVAIKSGTAFVAEGVLRMQSRYRLALTGTPIKNKLPDFFFLGAWVTGNHAQPTARWPYPATTEGRAQFSSDFGVMETNLTKQEKAEAKGEHGRTFIKNDPTQICNIHRLWRLFGPVLIRRRKDEIPDSDIVGKKIVPIHVMPGTRQKAVYGFQVSNPPPFDNLLAQLGAQLMCLRQAALFPASPNLRREGSPQAMSTHPFTPKTAAILKLATDLMAQGEQLVIASPFVEFSDHLAGVLAMAGIPALKLDGQTSPTKRGKLVKRFKAGEFPVMIVGIKGMAAGHNLDNCRHLVLAGLEWALDLNRQMLDRIHRLTSKLDVTIYVLITKGTSDERLADVWQTKGNSSDLALDGRLILEDREKMDVATFLREAVADFDPSAPTMDEAEIETRWNISGIPAIRDAFVHYRRLRPLKPEAPAASRPPATRPVRPAAVKRLDPVPSPAVNPQPRSLFELMKQRRAQQQQTSPVSSTTTPAPTRTALPIFKIHAAPPAQPSTRKPLPSKSA